MLRFPVVLGLLAMTGPLVSAQMLAASVDPSPAQPGGSVTLRLAVTGDIAVQFFDSCIIRRVTAFSPGGPVVRNASACADIVITLEGGQEITDTWDLRDDYGGEVTPGHYWLHVEASVDGAYERHAYPVTVADGKGSAPRLRVFSDAHLGTTAALVVDAPEFPGQPYFVAASASTDFGLPLGGEHLALDPDALFALSFPNPHPELFQGFQGELNFEGLALSISVQVPMIPSLVGQSIALQGLVFPYDGTPFRLTNVAHLVFVP